MCSWTGDQVDPMTVGTIGTRATERNLEPYFLGLEHAYETNPRNRKRID